MATQAQIDANRRNALKSTGPRTPEGKARASRNATTFGLYSKEILLPGEEAEQLRAIREDAFHRLDPVGQTETLYVERFVCASWRLRRALAGETRLLSAWRSENEYRDAAEVYTDEEIVRQLDRVHRHAASLERAMDRALAELRRLQKARRERPDEQIEANPPDLAAPLAGRVDPSPSDALETAKSNPIAMTEEAVKEQEGGERCEIEADSGPVSEPASADPSPGIATRLSSSKSIAGLCAAESV